MLTTATAASVLTERDGDGTDKAVTTDQCLQGKMTLPVKQKMKRQFNLAIRI